MYGIGQNVTHTLRRRQIIAQATNGIRTGWTATANIGPNAKQIDEEITLEFNGQHLRDDVQVGDKGRLQNDGNVGSVEQLDWIAAVLAAITGALDGQIDAETLEIDDDSKHQDGGQQVHQIGQILAIECLAQCTHFIVARGHQMEQSNYGALEFGATSRCHRGGREGLPHDRLAYVGRNEQRNARAQAIALLEQLVEQEHNETGGKQLNDDQQADAGTDFRWITVHAGHHIDNRLSNRYDHAE